MRREVADITIWPDKLSSLGPTTIKSSEFHSVSPASLVEDLRIAALYIL